MPATRTQVYLQPHQRQRLDEIAGSRGLSLASVIREAIDLYIANTPVDPTTALESTFGAAPEAQVPGRDDWADARRERLRRYTGWTADDFEEFDTAMRAQRVIDARPWE